MLHKLTFLVPLAVWGEVGGGRGMGGLKSQVLFQPVVIETSVISGLKPTSSETHTKKIVIELHKCQRNHDQSCSTCIGSPPLQSNVANPVVIRPNGGLAYYMHTFASLQVFLLMHDVIHDIFHFHFKMTLPL